jgi:hypothetical protein
MVILFSIKFNTPSGEENILTGMKAPLISGQVGAAVAALWPAINAPNAN